MSDDNNNNNNVEEFPRIAPEEPKTRIFVTFSVEYNTPQGATSEHYEGVAIISGEAFAVQDRGTGVPLFICPVSQLIRVTSETREVEVDDDGQPTVQ